MLENLRFVRALANRIHRAMFEAINIDDLIDAGTMSLIHAPDRYDAAQGEAFRGYARHRIRSSILDTLRDLDSAL